jgi:hypothetical protein
MGRIELPYRGTSDRLWEVPVSTVAGKSMVPLQMSKMARFWNFLECS